ncbi:MAG TPA: imidazole glycerol phosphate synthase subunit HisH [Solirubrobacteraceae bacterium]
MTACARVGVIDYGMGNRRSVQKAIERAGARAVVTADHRELDACDCLVLPGVGAFPLAMRRLRERGLDQLIRTGVSRGVALLGICLGMQLLFEHSEELEPSDGLGVLQGEVRRLRTGGLRLPHIGWSEVTFEQPSQLTRGLAAEGCPFYHVHSLTVHPADPHDVLGTAEYGERFPAIVGRGRVFGVQFHPEKSSIHGLQMLGAFVEMCSSQHSDGPARAAARV